MNFFFVKYTVILNVMTAKQVYHSVASSLLLTTLNNVRELRRTVTGVFQIKVCSVLAAQQFIIFFLL